MNRPENIAGSAVADAGDSGTPAARKEVEAAQAHFDQRLRDQQFYTGSLIESNRRKTGKNPGRPAAMRVSPHYCATRNCAR